MDGVPGGRIEDMNRMDMVFAAIVGVGVLGLGGVGQVRGLARAPSAVMGQPAGGPSAPPPEKAEPSPVPEGTPASQPTPETAPKTEEPSKPQDDPAYVLSFTVKDINGKDVNLEKYKGSVVVIVNVASRCGYTTQYEGLQRLYEKNKEDGLVVLGFPANNFGGQEPGTDDEIREFCSSKYGVSFPMFSKISVKGEDQHPLYKRLSGQPAPVGGDPKWNFTKFIVDRSGKVVARFNSNARPDDSGDPESKAMSDTIMALLSSRG